MIEQACRRGRRLVVAACVGIAIALLDPAPVAWAADDCGPPSGGLVICNAANQTNGGYHDADGITYTGADLTIRHLGDGLLPTQFIALDGGGVLSVQSNAAILQTQPGAPAGISVVSSDGPVTIVTGTAGAVLVTGDGVRGLRAETTGGSGEVVIDAKADVAALGDYTFTPYAQAAVFAQAVGGNVTVDTRSVLATGAGAMGVFASSLLVGGTTMVRVAGDVSSDNVGIFADGQGAVTVLAHDVETFGDNAPGVRALGSNSAAAVSVTADKVTTHGDASLGIWATSLLGSVAIEAQAVMTSGATANGILADSHGSLSITIGGAIHSGGAGIVALSDLGPITVRAGDIVSGGGGLTAVIQTGGSGEAIDIVTGKVVAAGNGIQVLNNAGAVTLRSGGVEVSGAGNDGVAVNGAGASQVEVTGAVSVEDGFGVQVAGTSVDLVTRAVTTGGGGGIGVRGNAALGPASITVLGQVTTSGTLAQGVVGSSGGGLLTIRTQGVSTRGEASSAIEASLFGTGSLSIEAGGPLETLGADAFGILFGNAGGPTQIVAEDISTAGVGATGIAGQSRGDIGILVKGTISTLGFQASGIDVGSTTGAAIAIETGAVSTAGDLAFGIAAGRSGPGTAAVSILVHGAIATAGEIATGILASNSGSGGIVITAAGVSTQGNAAYAILADDQAGGGTGGVQIRSAGQVSTAGDGALGINVFSRSSGIVIDADSVSTARAAANAIQATALGEGNAADVQVMLRGQVETQGLLAHGLFLQAVNGNIFADLHEVQATGLAAQGVLAVAADRVEIALDRVEGGAQAAGIAATVGQAALITVRAGGTLGSLADLAVSVDGGGDATLHLYGQALGTLVFAEGDDTVYVHDGGRLDLRKFFDSDSDGVRDLDGSTASSVFGDGEDLVVIERGGVLGLPTVADGEIGQLVEGLELLRNAGLIDLRETAPGLAVNDRMVISNLESDGGGLFLDVRLDAGGPNFAQATDRLVVTGDLTGITYVSVKNAGGLGDDTDQDVGFPTDPNQRGISIVQVKGAADAGAVQLAKPVVAGAWEYHLVHFDPYDLNDYQPDTQSNPDESDPELGFTPFHDYRLQSTFFPGVYEYAALVQGANLLGQAALGGLLDRPVAPDAIAQPGGGQGAALGLADTQEAVRATAGDGLALGGWIAGFGAGLRVSPGHDSDFHQDTYGLQVGYDAVGWRDLFAAGDRLLLGVAGTLAEGRVDFDGSDSKLDLSLYGAGVYAGYRAGGLKAGLVAQFLAGSGDYSAPYQGVDDDFGLTSLGLAGDAAWRFELGAAYLEPSARLAYVHSWSDDFSDGADVPITLDDSQSLVGRLAVELGTRIDSVSPYVRVGVSREFLGESEASASGLTFESSTRGTAFELGGGLAVWDLGNNLSLHLDATWRFGDEVSGLGASAALKLSW